MGLVKIDNIMISDVVRIMGYLKEKKIYTWETFRLHCSHRLMSDIRLRLHS